MKVICRVRQTFTADLALDIINNATFKYTECLEILDALHGTGTDFIINSDTEGWVTVRSDLMVGQEAVHYVLRELSAFAHKMSREEKDVAVVTSAARWGFLLFANKGDLNGREYGEGSSDVHEGLYRFVR
jgi:hypothetical protein